MLVVNADDWGASIFTTSKIEECIKAGVVDTVSAMVYMRDSRRACGIIKDLKMDTALHLNFTTPFDGDNVPKRLLESQLKIVSYLKGKKSAQFIYNPMLQRHFEYVYKSQYDEYCKLLGAEPQRIDGHNHMHLCANMLVGGFIPAKIKVRRNLHFVYEKKSIVNRAYRSVVDSFLTRRYCCTDYLLHIRQFMREDKEERIGGLRNLTELSKKAAVELLAHPHQQPDYEFMMSDEFQKVIGDNLKLV